MNWQTHQTNREVILNVCA